MPIFKPPVLTLFADDPMLLARSVSLDVESTLLLNFCVSQLEFIRVYSQLVKLAKSDVVHKVGRAEPIP